MQKYGDAGIPSGWIMEDNIHIYAGGCVDKERYVESFTELIQELEENRRALFECPDEIIIHLFAHFGKEIIKDSSLAYIPGLSYLSLWLRKENLHAIYLANFGIKPGIRDSIPVDSRSEMIHVPRGVVCHWIAGNIPLLGFFSLVLATLGKNASILKIHPAVYKYLNPLLQKLEEVTIEIDRVSYSGKVITLSVSLVSFPGKNEIMSRDFSLSADCRVIYGSHEAVQAISCLPHQVHADTIVYGPKYSFAVFDKEAVESPEFSSMLKGLAQDIVLYNQAACSSPHTIFFEKSKMVLHDIAEQLKSAFQTLPERMFYPLDEGIAISVINTRARFLLDSSKDILLPDDLKWTVCINDAISLEEPVQGRCVFVKEVSDIDQVLPLVTRKVQTVALGIVDQVRKERYVRELAYRGVDRVMAPGTMHEFTQPWDGMLGAGRMVRWIAVVKK